MFEKFLGVDVAKENIDASSTQRLKSMLAVLRKRDIVHGITPVKIRLVLDEATDAWGIKINRVEVKNINPPADIQMAMEKQRYQDL